MCDATSPYPQVTIPACTRESILSNDRIAKVNVSIKRWLSQ